MFNRAFRQIYLPMLFGNAKMPGELIFSSKQKSAELPRRSSWFWQLVKVKACRFLKTL
jgi:hypothetical protein